MTLVFVMSWIAGQPIYGFSKAQTPRSVFCRAVCAQQRRRLAAAFPPRSGAAFAVKEIKVFFRDQTQWPQIFLILALIVIYLYNFSVCPG